jgi:hypothetical protein
MSAFLKYVDSKTWKVVLKGWEHPVALDKDGNITDGLGPKKTASETPSVTESPKTRTKTAGVGPKKGWSKLKVKTTAGSSRKRKVISSSESEYDVEEDVPNIITSVGKKSAGKKSVQIVENVPIDKVSFHLLEFAQRWKFIIGD